MFRLIPNMFGGYDVIPIGAGYELLGGGAAILAIALLFSSIIEAIAFNVAAFFGAVLFILIGFLVILCGNGCGTFSFIACAAPMCFYYGLISICDGIYNNAQNIGSIGLFAIIGILFVVVLGGFLIVASCGVITENIGGGDVFGFLAYMLMFIGTIAGVIYNKYVDSWKYVFRVFTLFTLVWMAFSFIKWIARSASTGKFFKNFLTNIIYFALGVIPIFLIAILGTTETSESQMVFMFIIVCVMYILIAIACLYLYKTKNSILINGNTQFLFLPYLIINIAALIRHVTITIRAEAMEAAIHALEQSALVDQLASISEKSNAMFASVMTPVLNAIFSWTLKIFDVSASQFTLPAVTGAFIGIAVIHLATVIGAFIYSKIARTQNTAV